MIQTGLHKIQVLYIKDEFKVLRQTRNITSADRAAHPDTTILEHLKVAISPSFVWPPEDPSNLLEPFPTSYSGHKRIKVNFTAGLPPFPSGHPSCRAGEPSSVISATRPNESVPQATPPRPSKRRRQNPPDLAPAPVSASEDTTILSTSYKIIFVELYTIPLVL